MGRYLNFAPETVGLHDLCNRAAEERVTRAYSSSAPAAPRLTKSQNDEIAKLYSGGMKPADIAREIGTTEWTIHHRLNRLGIERRPRGMSVAQIDEARTLRESGTSWRQLSARYGYDARTIKKYLLA